MPPDRWCAAGTRLLLASVAGCGMAGSAMAQTGGLDLARAVELALTRNERAAAAGERQVAAEARVDQARSFFFPDLTASGTYTRREFETRRNVGGDEITVSSRNAFSGSIALSLAIFDARSIPLYRQAARDAQAAGLQTGEDRRLLGFEAADAFLLTIGTEQVEGAAVRRVEYARNAVTDAQARFDAGLVGSNDVTRAQLEAASAERSLANARTLMRNAYLQLGNLLDTKVEPPLVVPEAMLDSAASVTPDVAAVGNAAQSRRLDLAASRARAEALHFSAQEPLLRAVPNFTFGALSRFTNEQGLSGRDHDLSFGVTSNWPLYDGGQRYGERHERLALASIADLEARALARQVDLDVQQAEVTLEESQAALRASTAAAEAARKNAAETTELYRQGLSRVLEVADASVRLFEAEVAQASDRLGLGRAFLDWRTALGLDALGREP
jgi:outer membrane protein TolC